MSYRIENQIYRATVDFLAPLDITKCACDNCDWTGTVDQLDVVGAASLTPGHASPAGRCLECGALAYVIDSPHSQALAMLAALLPYATSRAEDMHAEGGDQCEYWQKADKAVSDTITMLHQHGVPVPGYTVNEWATSYGNPVYRLELAMRALSRSDAELKGYRRYYEAAAFKLAACIIAGDYQ